MDKSIKTIEISHLVKKFGSFAAVNDISFDVYKGEIFGFLGANGAGKTTAMRILCGLSFPTSGEGTVAGFSIKHEPEVLPLSRPQSMGEHRAVQRHIRTVRRPDSREDRLYAESALAGKRQEHVRT